MPEITPLSIYSFAFFSSGSVNERSIAVKLPPKNASSVSCALYFGEHFAADTAASISSGVTGKPVPVMLF